MLIRHLVEKSLTNTEFLVNSNDNHNVTFVNSYSYLKLRDAKIDFSKIEGFYYDGLLMVLFMKLFFRIPLKRVSFDMTSLAPIVFKHLERTKKDVVFVGAKKNEIEDFIDVIKVNYPKIKITGYRDGYFNELSKKTFLKEISQKNPSIIIVGMGAILQEEFLVDLKDLNFKGLGFTCGGFIHQTSKKLHYYPKFVNQFNLRWLYRLYDEPKLISRFLWSYFLFPFIFTFDYLKYKLSYSEK